MLCCVDDCLVRTLHTRQSSTQNNKYQVPHKYSCFSWWWGHSRPKHVEINRYTKNKYTKNKLYKLALFTRLYRDAQSTQHKKEKNTCLCVCRVGFSHYWEHLLTVGVKSSQNGNDRRCLKTGLSDTLGITHEGDPLARYSACPLNCQASP